MKALCLTMMCVLTAGAWAVLAAPDIDGKLYVGYDATSVTTVWDEVGQVWRITSLNDQVQSYNALAPTEARRPILAQMDTGNGQHAVIDFDGVNDYLVTSAFASALPQSNTLFIVAARDTILSSYLMDGLTASSQAVGTLSSGRYAINAGTGVFSAASVLAKSGIFEIFTVLFQSGEGGNSRMFVTDANGSTQVLLGNAGTGSLAGLNIGRTVGSGYLNGQIAELLVYNGAMSTAQMESVQDYLLSKYLIPEPATIVLLGIGLLISVRTKRSA